MREIKFRAWDGERMIEWGFLRDGIFTGPASSGKGNPMTMKQMQFTGLKDKNGREIYEGDILKSDNGNIGEVKWDDQYGTWRNICRKSESCLCLNMPFPLWNSFHNPKSIEFKATVEVIGNIYELESLPTERGQK